MKTFTTEQMIRKLKGYYPPFVMNENLLISQKFPKHLLPSYSNLNSRCLNWSPGNPPPEFLANTGHHPAERQKIYPQPIPAIRGGRSWPMSALFP